jgi:2-iminobutanoate/2-iminopropanoate deaminase
MTQHHKLTDMVAADAPFSHIVDTGDTIHLSGIIAADDLAATQDSFASIARETETCLTLIARMLASVSLSLTDVTTVLVHMTDLAEFDAMNAAYSRYFPQGREPVRTCVQVAGLLDGARIEITCQAHRK